MRNLIIFSLFLSTISVASETNIVDQFVKLSDATKVKGSFQKDIKAATKTRIDLGLKLKDVEVQGCLENSGPFGTMCSHRVQLQNISDVDTDVIKWLSMAYEQSI